MKTQVAAIDFGTSKVVTLIAQSGGVNRCDIIGSGTVPYDGFAQGDWNTPEQLARVARDSIAAAELDELLQVVPRDAAGAVYEYFHREKKPEVGEE